MNSIKPFVEDFRACVIRSILTELWDPNYTEEGDYVLPKADEPNKEPELE